MRLHLVHLLRIEVGDRVLVRPPRAAAGGIDSENAITCGSAPSWRIIASSTLDDWNAHLQAAEILGVRRQRPVGRELLEAVVQ